MLFKAMVLEYTDSWYMDDGELTKKFCAIGEFVRTSENDLKNFRETIRSEVL